MAAVSQAAVQPGSEAVRQVAPVAVDRLQHDGGVQLLPGREPAVPVAGEHVDLAAELDECIHVDRAPLGVAGVDEVGHRPGAERVAHELGCRWSGRAAVRGTQAASTGPRAKVPRPRSTAGKVSALHPPRPGPGLRVVVEAVAVPSSSVNIADAGTAAGPRCCSRGLSGSRRREVVRVTGVADVLVTGDQVGVLARTSAASESRCRSKKPACLGGLSGFSGLSGLRRCRRASRFTLPQ